LNKRLKAQKKYNFTMNKKCLLLHLNVYQMKLQIPSPLLTDISKRF